MRERPILFSGAMVRAILDGHKTQTRRIMKRPPQPVMVDGIGTMPAVQKANGNGHWLWPNARAQVLAECPYGVPGDHLWVRETFMVEPHPADVGITREMIPRTWDSAVAAAGTVHYAADPGAEIRADGRRWRPSIHMPRSACRLVLGITDVRVERLQAISEADVVAEGISTPGPFTVHHFRDVWNSINGAGAWDANPWVWALTLHRVAG